MPLRFYRPQTKFVKVMFLHLSVSHSVHGRGGGVPGQVHPQAGTLPGRYITPASACWDTVNKRAVRILMECILVVNYISGTTGRNKD